MLQVTGYFDERDIYEKKIKNFERIYSLRMRMEKASLTVKGERQLYHKHTKGRFNVNKS